MSEEVPRAVDLREWAVRIARGSGPKALADTLTDDEWWEQIVEFCGPPPSGTEWHTRVVEALLAMCPRGPDRVVEDADGGASIYLFSTEKTDRGGSVRRASIHVAPDGACLALWQKDNGTVKTRAIGNDMLLATQEALDFVERRA